MLRVLCAGDRFIRAESLAAEAATMAGDVEVVPYETRWPDEPFGAVDGVREASGDPAVLGELLADAHVMLTHLAPVTAEMFAGAPHLRIVGVTRGGPVNVDLDAATAHGVPVVYLPGRNLGAVAEFVLGVMIALTRNVVASSHELARGHWDAKYFRFDLTGPELRAATVGLVGLGAVGSRVAELTRAFGSRVLAHDPYAAADAVLAAGAQPVSLEELLARSDIVTVHARLTDDTRGMFDAKAFAAMKPGAYFVNTARGEIVDQSALADALDSGHLAGAALDVFHPEPPRADERLLDRPNVIATPHLAGASRQVALESVERVTAEVGAFLRTGHLQHCANPQWTERR